MLGVLTNDRMLCKMHNNFSLILGLIMILLSMASFLMIFCLLFSACSEGYNISRYPAFSKLNSQAAEQLNSAIKPLASMLCYMQHDNFIQFTKLHIWFRNMLRKYKTAPHDNFSYAFVFLAMSNLR